MATDLGSIIEQAKDVAFRAVDVVLVYRNWRFGKRIAEEELKGAVRAEYGKETMRALAEELTAKYGAGFDFGSLYKYLVFFKRFETLASLSPKSGRLLSWTHYRKLLQIEDNAAMRWYLDEAAAEAWSVRTLQRNISSQYYERTLLSRSKDTAHAEMIKITSLRRNIGFAFRATRNCVRKSRRRREHRLHGPLDADGEARMTRTGGSRTPDGSP